MNRSPGDDDYFTLCLLAANLSTAHHQVRGYSAQVRALFNRWARHDEVGGALDAAISTLADATAALEQALDLLTDARLELP